MVYTMQTATGQWKVYQRQHCSFMVVDPGQHRSPLGELSKFRLDFQTVLFMGIGLVISCASCKTQPDILTGPDSLPWVRGQLSGGREGLCKEVEVDAPPQDESEYSGSLGKNLP